MKKPSKEEVQNAAKVLAAASAVGMIAGVKFILKTTKNGFKYAFGKKNGKNGGKNAKI